MNENNTSIDYLLSEYLDPFELYSISSVDPDTGKVSYSWNGIASGFTYSADPQIIPELLDPKEALRLLAMALNEIRRLRG